MVFPDDGIDLEQHQLSRVEVMHAHNEMCMAFLLRQTRWRGSLISFRCWILGKLFSWEMPSCSRHASS